MHNMNTSNVMSIPIALMSLFPKVSIGTREEEEIISQLNIRTAANRALDTVDGLINQE